MNYGAIKTTDIANGLGVRTSLFVSGCRRHCKGCFNEEAWDFDFGEPFTSEVEDRIIESLRPYYTHGLTILGGEPMEPENQRALYPFLLRFRKELPDKNIWCYTGFTLERDLLGWSSGMDETAARSLPDSMPYDMGIPRCEVTDGLLSLIDILVDGEFIEEQKSLTLNFRGSANQRIIDMRATLAAGKVILADIAELS